MVAELSPTIRTYVYACLLCADYIEGKPLTVALRQSVPPPPPGKVSSSLCWPGMTVCAHNWVRGSCCGVKTLVVVMVCAYCSFLQVLPGPEEAANHWGSTTCQETYRQHDIEQREQDRLAGMRTNHVRGAEMCM